MKKNKMYITHSMKQVHKTNLEEICSLIPVFGIPFTLANIIDSVMWQHKYLTAACIIQGASIGVIIGILIWA